MRKFKPGEICPIKQHDVEWQWQFYWKKWGIGSITFTDVMAEFGMIERVRVIVIGPLQLRRIQRDSF